MNYANDIYADWHCVTCFRGVNIGFRVWKAQYFSGESIGVFPIYERENVDIVASIEVAETDLPVRIIVTTTGHRPITHAQVGRPFASFDVDYGNGAPSENIRLTFGSDMEISTITWLSHTQSFLLKNNQPRRWHIRLIDTGFRQFNVERVTANIKLRSAPPNFIQPVVGFVTSGFGFVFVMGAWLIQQRRV